MKDLRVCDYCGNDITGLVSEKIGQTEHTACMKCALSMSKNEEMKTHKSTLLHSDDEDDNFPSEV